MPHVLQFPKLFITHHWSRINKQIPIWFIMFVCVTGKPIWCWLNSNIIHTGNNCQTTAFLGKKWLLRNTFKKPILLQGHFMLPMTHYNVGGFCTIGSVTVWHSPRLHRKYEHGHPAAALLVSAVHLRFFRSTRIFIHVPGERETWRLWLSILRLGKDGKIIKKKILPTVLLRENEERWCMKGCVKLGAYCCADMGECWGNKRRFIGRLSFAKGLS